MLIRESRLGERRTGREIKKTHPTRWTSYLREVIIEALLGKVEVLMAVRDLTDARWRLRQFLGQNVDLTGCLSRISEGNCC